MIPLPNENWLRSPLLPTYALCLDPSAPYFGWKMVEDEVYRRWVGVSKLEEAEVIAAISYPSCSTHVEQLTKLLSDMQGEVT